MERISGKACEFDVYEAVFAPKTDAAVSLELPKGLRVRSKNNVYMRTRGADRAEEEIEGLVFSSRLCLLSSSCILRGR